MAIAGISTLGVVMGYGLETTPSTKPTSFVKLNRINEIGGINIEPETVDASALEDEATRSVAGRASSGGTFTVTVNYTDETADEWATLISAYKGLDTGKRMWFEIYSPKLAKAFFIVAQPPTVIPMPSFAQNELLKVEFQLTIEEYIGYDTAVVPA